MKGPNLSYFRTAALVCLLAASSRSFAERVQSECSLGPITHVEALKNGLRLSAGVALEEVTVLRADVVRVRISQTGVLPEDASWAVLAEARRSAVPVSVEAKADTIGFRTSMLQAEVSRRDLKLTIRSADGKVVQQDARPACFQGPSFRVYKTMPADEHYFGLGDKTGPFDRRGQAFSLWNTDSYRFQESTDPLYKSIPFFITYRAGTSSGVLLDNTWRSSFDFGKIEPSTYSFGAVDGPLDYYVVVGPAPRDVLKAYAWLTGTPPLPPIWALGFQQSRYSYSPESKLIDVAERLRADRVPADVLYLDIDFQYKNRPFTVDPAAFPDFAGTVAKLRAMDFHVVAITDLHIAKAPGQRYAPYDSGIEGNHFVHNPDGSVYQGTVWPGTSVFPDFTQQQTRTWWGNLYKPFVDDGIAGFWNDMNEPSVFNTPTKTFPESVMHRIDEPGFLKRTGTHAELHNVYGMENSRATFEGLLALRPRERPFVLTRATYAGGQRYAFTWTGDDSSTWNHLRMTTPMLKNLGLSGFAFSGADVGGFAGSQPTNLLTRWLEVAAFHPLDRDHSEKGTDDKEPWVGGAEQESIRRRFIEERYRLMPYIYTLAEETSRTGLPMMRPLFLDYPNAAPDGHPLDIDPDAAGEFLLGHDLLIAASPYSEEPDGYTVELPTSVWYDYWTGEKVKNVRTLASDPSLPEDPAKMAPLSKFVRPDLASLPVFVRGGAIVPVAPLVQSTNETPQGPLTLRLYAGEECKGDVYLDDGRSYRYKNGQSLRMRFTCDISQNELQLRISRHEGTYPAWWKQLRVEIYGWTPSKGILVLHGHEAPHDFEAIPNGIALMLEDNGNGLIAAIR